MLDKTGNFVKNIMNRMLSLIKEKIATSVLIHILICLSYLSK